MKLLPCHSCVGDDAGARWSNAGPITPLLHHAVLMHRSSCMNCCLLVGFQVVLMMGDKYLQHVLARERAPPGTTSQAIPPYHLRVLKQHMVSRLAL